MLNPYSDLVVVINELKRDEFLLNAFNMANEDTSIPKLLRAFDIMMAHVEKHYPKLNMEEAAFYLKYFMGLLFIEIREKEKIIKRSDFAGYTVQKYRPQGLLFSKACEVKDKINRIGEQYLADSINPKKGVAKEELEKFSTIANVLMRNNDSSITRYSEAAAKVLDVERNIELDVVSDWTKVLEDATGRKVVTSTRIKGLNSGGK